MIVLTPTSIHAHKKYTIPKCLYMYIMYKQNHTNSTTNKHQNTYNEKHAHIQHT